MEKSYRNIVYFFIGIAVIIFIGFFRSYFSQFPFFSETDAFHHFHAIVLLLWIALLIAQPILIKKGRHDIHRALGKFSYFLVPVMVVSMLMAYRIQYLRLEKLGIPRAENLAFLFAPLTDVLPFTLFYILAVFNTRNIPAHMRYIIATALVVVGAGIVRTLLLLFDLEIGTVFELSTVITFCLFVVFIIFDRINGKQFWRNPMVVALLIFAVPNGLSFVVPNLAWWQHVAGVVAEAF